MCKTLVPSLGSKFSFVHLSKTTSHTTGKPSPFTRSKSHQLPGKRRQIPSNNGLKSAFLCTLWKIPLPHQNPIMFLFQNISKSPGNICSLSSLSNRCQVILVRSQFPSTHVSWAQPRYLYLQDASTPAAFRNHDFGLFRSAATASHIQSKRTWLRTPECERG